jgi:BlaI family transcriptional regulator, penicillinase repressor
METCRGKPDEHRLDNSEGKAIWANIPGRRILPALWSKVKNPLDTSYTCRHNGPTTVGPIILHVLQEQKTAMAKEKPAELPALSEAQLEIMQIVWGGTEVTVTDVWNVLSKRRQVSRNTVLTLMDRLEKKGWLKRRAEGQTHLYTAAAPRARTLGRVVQRLVDAAFAGSAEGLVLALLEGRGVTDAEARRIRQLIDEARTRRDKP